MSDRHPLSEQSGISPRQRQKLEARQRRLAAEAAHAERSVSSTLVWMIWIQGDDGHTWLEAAWDDEMTADNHDGWREEVDKARKLVAEGYEMRIQRVRVPGVFEMFDFPEAEATRI